MPPQSHQARIARSQSERPWKWHFGWRPSCAALAEHSLRGAFEHAPDAGPSIDLQGRQNRWVTIGNKYVEAIRAGEHPLLHAGVVEVIYAKSGPHPGLRVAAESLCLTQLITDIQSTISSTRNRDRSAASFTSAWRSSNDWRISGSPSAHHMASQMSRWLTSRASPMPFRS